MNPILMLARNNRYLTRRAVASALHQDIPVNLMVVDDGSTDGTSEMLEAISEKYNNMMVVHAQNRGVSRNWNLGLRCFFSQGAEHVLVLNNDVILGKSFYRNLLEVEGGLVSGISTSDISEVNRGPAREFAPHPDFSGYLLRREAWKKLGPFDDRMQFYCSDNDYHVRAHRLGIPFVNSGVPFYHERSSTLKNAPREEHEAMCKQADADRAVFKSIYGCEPWEPAYADLFKEMSV